MRIILNADDFGMSDDTVDATIACFEQGGLSSATIMARMPATARALEYANAHPEFGFGVHLTYCGDGDGIERAVCDPAEIPALVDGDGRFPATTAVRLRALASRLPRDQIERETRAQLALVRNAGIPISHVDSHSHLHKIGAFREALAAVLHEFGIRRVRAVQSIYLSRPLFNVTYWLGGTWTHRLRAAFETTDHFYMPSSSLDTHWSSPLLSHLGNEGTLEVGVHPGNGEEWRVHERDDVLEFSRLAREAGHTIHSWNDAFGS